MANRYIIHKRDTGYFRRRKTGIRGNAMKNMIALLLAFTMAFGLAACGGSSEETEPTETSAETTPTAAPTGTTVVYWSMWDADDTQGQVISQAVQSFTAETGIAVDLQFKGSALQEELPAALAAGETVDVFDGDLDWVNDTFGSDLMDLEEQVDKFSYEETAIGGLMDACRDAGKGTLRSVPYQSSMVNFFYNKTIFEEVGVTVPGDWDDLLEVCEAIKAAGYTPITCDDTYITSMFGYHMGRLTDEDGVCSIVQKAKWDESDVEQFAEEYAELASLGYFSAGIGSNVWPAGQNELLQGTAAMYLSGTQAMIEAEAASGVVLGCFAYPEVDGGETEQEAAYYSADVLAIHSSTQVPNDAFKLVNYLTKGESDRNMAQRTSGIPADTENTADSALMASIQSVMDDLTNRWSWAAGAESNDEITAAIKENTLKLCSGSITAEEFVENMLSAAGVEEEEEDE